MGPRPGPPALSALAYLLFIQKQMSGWRRVAGLLFRRTVSAAAEGRRTLGHGSVWPSRRHSVLGDLYLYLGWGGVEFCGLAALSLLLVYFLETILEDLHPSCSVTLIYYIFIQQTHYKKYSHARGHYIGASLQGQKAIGSVLC